ncbi:MAG: class I SAM-dependent methyltransferase [Candidatus Marinimicrobia bacterium]|nr:class I SAM-dependent methyltransferase [Candidatus Neomarinimicrobiota bacterium]
MDERMLNGCLLARCSKCSFVFADVSLDEVRRHNYHVSSSTDSFYMQSQTKLDNLWFWSVVCRVTRKTKAGRVLDVGCGNGMLLKHFKAMGWHCYGLDVSPWAKKYAKFYGFTLYDKEIEEDYLPENYFDLVVSTSTLEHIYDPYKHLKSALRILKPGGYLYVAGVPNYNSLTIKLGLSKFYFNKPPSHVNYFTPRSIYNLINRLKRYYKISFKIGTYGIPESFYFYHKIRETYKKLINKRRVKRGINNNKRITIEKISKEVVLGNREVYIIKKVIGQIAVYLSYVIGRPFNLGDKIEVIIYKEQ